MAAPTQQEIDDAVAAALLNAVQNPYREQSGTRVVEERKVDDLLAAIAAIQSNVAASQPSFGIRMTRLVPPGCG